jgi:hypothetical protein
MADSSDEAQSRAEANFKKKEQQTRESDEVWAEHAAAAKATDAKTARLRAQRLAKEAADKLEAEKQPPKAQTKRSAKRTRLSSGL